MRRLTALVTSLVTAAVTAVVTGVGMVAGSARPASAATPGALFSMRPGTAAPAGGGPAGGGAASGGGPTGGGSAAGRFSYTVGPGHDVAGAVVVSNLGDGPLHLTLYGADLIPLPGTGGFTVGQKGQRATGVGAWVGVPGDVWLTPREERTVPFSLSVPTDAGTGDYGGAVVAQSDPQGAKGVAVETRVALEVLVRVPGPTLLDARLGPLRARRVGGALLLTASLRNTGRETFRYRGNVVVRQGSSAVLVLAPLRPSASVLLPGQEVQLTGEWSHIPRFSSVTGHAEVTAVPVAGPPRRFSDAAVRLVAFPWLFVVLALVALALLVAVGRRTWRYACSGSTSARAKPS